MQGSHGNVATTTPPLRQEALVPRRGGLHLQLFYHSFLEFFRALPGAAQRFWVLVLVTGVIAGLGAVALIGILEGVQRLAWPPALGFLPKVRLAPPLWRVLVPLGGGALVSLATLLVRWPIRGHGTGGIIEAIWVRKGRLPLMRALLRAAISIVAVGMGASLGREGALLQTGAAAGSSLAARLRLSEEQARLLVACGAAAGLAAAYNVPIGGALFGLEVLLGSFALELFGPIVVCCVTATVISRMLVSSHPSYLIPHYGMLGFSEMLLALALAPILGLAAALFVKAIEAAAALAERVPSPLSLLLPPLVMGMLGVASVAWPELLGNGYDTVDAALSGALPLALLLGLPFVKLAFTAACSGSGIPGGLFTPSLFFGALVGGALGDLGQRLFHGTTSSGVYALLGMAAVMAGTTHAAVSSVLIIYEMTGDYDVILPLMVTCVVAAAVSRRIEPESLYTAALKRRRVELPEPPKPHWLRATRVAAVLEQEVERLPLGASFETIVVRLLQLAPGHELYVTAADGRLLGAIRLDTIKRHIDDKSLLKMIIAADIMEPLAGVPLTTTLHELAARFAETDRERLPVVDAGGKLVGTVSKSDILQRSARY
ncbi:MAG TPA: chloride channel protein [Polyangia bacterium]|nr:chloride channel protein [Polyangia bacterium]